MPSLVMKLAMHSSYTPLYATEFVYDFGQTILLLKGGRESGYCNK